MEIALLEPPVDCIRKITMHPQAYQQKRIFAGIAVLATLSKQVSRPITQYRPKRVLDLHSQVVTPRLMTATLGPKVLRAPFRRSGKIKDVPEY
jgi:hypothetical protein